MIMFTGVLYTSLFTGSATAQSTADVSFSAEKIDKKTNSAETDKPGAITPADKTSVKELDANLKAAKVNMKVTSHLNRNFKNVSDLTWNTEEKVIVARFKLDEKTGRVVYDKKGHWLYSVITFQEEQMPQNIRSLVRNSYNGFTISLVQEISQGDITLYKVYLENPTSLKHILVYDNEITPYEDFTKSR